MNMNFYKVPGQFNISNFENFENIALKGNDFNTVAVHKQTKIQWL